ncbi:MAG: amidase [Pseudomonadota bacterium]|nr:amidase [Pseudomonadota bacterium]
MMTRDEWESCDMTALAGLRSKGEISPRELVETAIARIEALNPAVNAVVIEAYDAALAQLEARTDAPAWLGMPYLVKDLHAPVRGLPLTNGSRLFAGMPAPDIDSNLVARLRAAGFVFLGRTNSPELGLNASTEPLAYGPTRNPWNTGHIAGGSSGGAGAAVASGMLPAAHATDSAGSIRIPASCNGLVGLKPTRGLNPFGPHRGDANHGISHEHAVTRTVRDTAALLDITAGPDTGAPYFSPPPAGGFVAAIATPPRRLKIAFWPASWWDDGIDPECAGAVRDAAGTLEALGHDVVEARPEFEAREVIANMMTVLMTTLGPMLNMVERQIGRKIGPEDLEPQSLAVLERARGTSIDTFVVALMRMQLEVRRMAAFFETHDVLVTPTLTLPPPPLGHLPTDHGDVDAFLEKLFGVAPFAAPFNASGQPAISLPLAWSRTGLPIGVQFVGRYGADAGLLQLAAQIEAARPWFGKRPAIAA